MNKNKILLSIETDNNHLVRSVLDKLVSKEGISYKRTLQSNNVEITNVLLCDSCILSEELWLQIKDICMDKTYNIKHLMMFQNEIINDTVITIKFAYWNPTTNIDYCVFSLNERSQRFLIKNLSYLSLIINTMDLKNQEVFFQCYLFPIKSFDFSNVFTVYPDKYKMIKYNSENKINKSKYMTNGFIYNFIKYFNENYHNFINGNYDKYSFNILYLIISDILCYNYTIKKDNFKSKLEKLNISELVLKELNIYDIEASVESYNQSKNCLLPSTEDIVKIISICHKENPKLLLEKLFANRLLISFLYILQDEYLLDILSHYMYKYFISTCPEPESYLNIHEDTSILNYWNVSLWFIKDTDTLEKIYNEDNDYLYYFNPSYLSKKLLIVKDLKK